MKTVGIVMECNPFHEGHQYIIARGKDIAEGGPVIAVMSGDFVQRGIPAVQPKEERVRQVLEAGADMVLELPVRYATASAESFAAGAVSILNAAEIVTDLVFGSESGEIKTLQEQARFLVDEPEEYRTLLRKKLSEGLPFPAARAAAAAECPQHIALPSTPNDLLGEEYLKALLCSSSRIIPHAVTRIPARTASDIRKDLQKEGRGLFADDLSPLLFAKLFSLSARQYSSACPDPDSTEKEAANGFGEWETPALQHYAGVTQNLANRIVHLLPRFVSWTQFCNLVKTRNITYTAVSRALLHILLDIQRSVPSPSETPSADAAPVPQGQRAPAAFSHLPLTSCRYIRVLGARRSALSLLGEIRSRNDTLFIVTDHASCQNAMNRMQEEGFSSDCRNLGQDIRTSELYDLVARMKQQRETAETSVPAVSEFSKPLIIL